MISLRKAINEKCKACTYDELDAGTWRGQVDACDLTHCPLHPVRPRKTRKSLAKNEQPAALKAYRERKALEAEGKT